MDFEAIVAAQREYFNTGATRTYEFRMSSLMKLKEALYTHEQDIYDAMLADMNKCRSEVYMTEIGMVLEDLRCQMKHLKSWMKNRHVASSLTQFPASSFVAPEPYGVALIMSPWNYPIMLTLGPLVGAIAAGCTAVVKPSAYAPATSHVIATIISEQFKPEYIAVVEGGRQENAALLEQKFDYIFFTGSAAVGRLVMESAAKHLTPVTLELGGKSPVIVDKTANIATAARRIAFGKTLNAGQTCVEPDYLFIHEDVKDEFVRCYEDALREFFPAVNEAPDVRFADMNVIINDKHFNRVKGLMEGCNILVGGYTNDERRFIEPTLLDGVTPSSPIMREEIFGPLLPVITFKDIENCIKYIRSNAKPLALYLFSTDRKVQERILDTCSFGGGCINDTIIHLATTKMPFGGVGESGMGCYHGRKSFDTFTHYRSIVKKGTSFDPAFRYRPYSKLRDKLVKMFLK